MVILLLETYNYFKLVLMVVIHDFIGSFFEIRENHTEGYGQLEVNMAPPI